VISLFGTPTEQQPPVFARILQALRDYRSRTGRPHWYLIDEAHYPLSAKWQPYEEMHLDEVRSVMYVSAFPEQLPQTILGSIDLFVAIGDDPAKHIAKYCELLGEVSPEVAPSTDAEEHRAIAWWRRDGKPTWFKRTPPPDDLQRHRHGYLDGDMDSEHRFYFRGPDDKLNLPAQNLRIFMQVGEGVDDKTWQYHLRNGDYSRWFRDIIKDEDLARRADALRKNGHTAPDDSRKQLFDFIRQKYEQNA